MFVNRFPVLLRSTPYIVNTRLKWTLENSELFTKLFDMPANDFRNYRNETNLSPISSEQLHLYAEVCKNCGIPKQEWLAFPALFKLFPQTIEQHYWQLKEGGFTNVNAGTLASYRRCMRHKISYLKMHSLIPQDVNVAKHFISHIQPKPGDLDIKNLTDDHTFMYVHHWILTRYLMWKFEKTQDAIEKFYRVYSAVKIKSFTFLCQNISIAEELGYTPKKILKCGYLLTTYPQHVKTVLAEMPNLAGADMRKAMKMYPKLIGISPNNLREIYGYLKEANIPDKSIQKSMNIFHLSPTTVKIRLEEIQTVPELRVLLNNPRILTLIIHHNQARSRLSFLQELKLKCATVCLLGTTQDYFSNYVRGGKDINTTNEILHLVKHLLNTESDVVKNNLKKHSYFQYVSLVRIVENYDFLRNLKFTNQAILDVIQILLYPSCKLKEAYEKISTLTKENATITEKLNLMLYIVEKEHHFTGNGIWNDDKH